MFCDNCGNELKEGMKFCSRCGQKVFDENVPKFVEGEKQKSIKGKISPKVYLVIIVLLVIVAGSFLIIRGVKNGKSAKDGLVTESNEKETFTDSGLSNPVIDEEGNVTWDCVYFGNYVQTDTEGDSKDPIKWRVLSVDGKDAFLLADCVLDMKPYDISGEENVSWETCSLRKWLNGEFLETAFNEEEQQAIIETKVKTEAHGDDPYYDEDNITGKIETEDKIYLLSPAEALNTDLKRFGVGYGKIERKSIR